MREVNERGDWREVNERGEGRGIEEKERCVSWQI